MKRHVSRHLRQIAVFPLPRADYYTEDDEDDEWDQSSRAIGYSAGQSIPDSSKAFGAFSSLSSRGNVPHSNGSAISHSSRLQSAIGVAREEEYLSRLDPESAGDSNNIPPDSEPLSWDQIGAYGVINARDGRSEHPPNMLPRFDPHDQTHHNRHGYEGNPVAREQPLLTSSSTTWTSPAVLGQPYPYHNLRVTVIAGHSLIKRNPFSGPPKISALGSILAKLI
ncbi:hypothetical protein V8F06_009346 [Rhypophila decipiens]